MGKKIEEKLNENSLKNGGSTTIISKDKIYNINGKDYSMDELYKILNGNSSTNNKEEKIKEKKDENSEDKMNNIKERINFIIEKYSKLKLPENVIEKIVRANYADTESDHFSEAKISELIKENIYYSDINNIINEYLKFITNSSSDIYVEELLNSDKLRNRTKLEKLADFLDLFDNYRELLSNDKISEASNLLLESRFLNRHCAYFNFMKTTILK